MSSFACFLMIIFAFKNHNGYKNRRWRREFQHDRPSKKCHDKWWRWGSRGPQGVICRFGRGRTAKDAFLETSFLDPRPPYHTTSGNPHLLSLLPRVSRSAKVLRRMCFCLTCRFPAIHWSPSPLLLVPARRGSYARHPLRQEVPRVPLDYDPGGGGVGGRGQKSKKAPYAAHAGNVRPSITLPMEKMLAG